MVSAFDSESSGLSSNLAEDIVLCYLARHFTLTVPLSGTGWYRYTGTGELNAGGVLG